MSDKKARKLIEQLLSHNPEQRHGGSFGALKAHPWFEDFNWVELINQNSARLEPPYITEKKFAISKKELGGKSNTRLIDCLKDLELEQNLNEIDIGDK